MRVHFGSILGVIGLILGNFRLILEKSGSDFSHLRPIFGVLKVILDNFVLFWAFSTWFQPILKKFRDFKPDFCPFSAYFWGSKHCSGQFWANIGDFMLNFGLSWTYVRGSNGWNHNFTTLTHPYMGCVTRKGP